SAVEDHVLHPAIRGLARRLHNLAIRVIKPAVVAAANAAPLDHPELEGRATMRAMQLQQADLTAAVSEKDQILPQDADPLGQVVDLTDEPHRMPKAPQV